MNKRRTFCLPEVPTISVPKSTVLVANGDTAILQCYASGIPSPKIKWYKGNIEVCHYFIETT